MLYCSLCFKTREKPGSKTFFKVPKEEHRRKQWSEVCRIDFKKRTAWLCPDHFLPSQIVRSGKKKVLVPNAVPFITPIKDPQVQKNEVGKIVNSRKKKNKKVSENEEEELLQNEVNTNKNVLLPQIQKNLVMEIPIRKSVFCTGSTQTNTRLCGLVQASEYGDEFRFSCFYCSEVFPLEKWEDFINHLKKKHFEIEKAFEVSEYVSEDHDYTPINLPISTPPPGPVSESVGINVEPLLPYLLDEEEPTHNPIESIVLNPTFYYTPDGNKTASNNIDILNYLIESGSSVIVVDSEESMDLKSNFYPTQDDNLVSVNADIFNNFIETSNASVSTRTSGIIKKLTSSKKPPQTFSPNCFKNVKSKSIKQKNLKINKTRTKSMPASKSTVLSRCLKRTNKVKEEKSGSVKINQQKATEISFEYTPRVIVDLLLDSMRNYPVLWQFNNEPFNEDFSKAIESLCKLINDKWSLNIDSLKMRRSINRILRFYCYLFPNENIENIHQYTCYYDKCAEYLPSFVNEIAYARCSHCFICYKNDYDLKRHLLREQRHNLQWPYKCVQCKECFKEEDEYEFHQLLSHYDEIFRCEPCNKKFIRRNIYNKHIAEYHSIVPKEAGKYKCELCDREFETIHSLRYHKITHGERKHKCHLCPKSYFESAKLRLHLKMHQREYDFMCEICGKEFLLEGPLKIHMKKHTGEKVTCTICNLKLRKSSLSRHLRLLHSANEGTVETTLKKGRHPNYRRLIRPTPYRRKKECEMRNYKCKICRIIFEKYKLLAEHNKEFHSDIPKLSCKMCTTEFSHKVNLKRHYRRKHNLHVIQAYKLVEENEDLDEVLAIKMEYLNKLAGTSSRKSPIIKSEFLSDEISFEEEKIQSFTIEEEILTASDIAKEEIKIDYIGDFFTDILK